MEDSEEEAEQDKKEVYDLMTEEHTFSQFMRARGAGVTKMTSRQKGWVWITPESDDAFYEQPSRTMEKN